MRPAASPFLRAALAIALLGALLPLPSRPGDYAIPHFAPPPADLAAILLVLYLVPGRARLLRGLLVAILAPLTLLRLADLGMILAFQRRFNPVLDWHLPRAGWELAAGTVGAWTAAAALLAALAAFLALLALLAWSLGGLPRLSRRARLGLAAAALAALPLAAPPVLPGEIGARAERLRAALEDEARFAAALERDDLPAPDFAALEGRDVIFLFVESYGRSWLEPGRFGGRGRARLAAAGARLEAAGFSARSAWLASPTRGGQSWLAHAAAMSGLWTSSQSRYDALLASDRASLNRLFARAGWRSVAVMPAIVRDWPRETRWFGYETLLDRGALGYRGQPFAWVTMPDQYTLGALDRLARAVDRPAMIEVGLISSHAPWTPRAEIVPWDEIGDGSIFDGTRRRGGAPREVWSAPETIRDAYSRALDYAVEVAAQWIARAAGDALVVVLGDHQPAPLVTGQGASAAVPVHVIARDPALLARLPGRWSDGMLPASDLPERPMTALREMLATCFSSGGCPGRSRQSAAKE